MANRIRTAFFYFSQLLAMVIVFAAGTPAFAG